MYNCIQNNDVCSLSLFWLKLYSHCMWMSKSTAGELCLYRILLTEYYRHTIHTITSLSRVMSGQWCTHPLKSGWEFYPAEWYQRKTWEILRCWTVVSRAESERLCRLRKPDRMLRLKRTRLGKNQELHTLRERDHCKESVTCITVNQTVTINIIYVHEGYCNSSTKLCEHGRVKYCMYIYIVYI